MVSPFSLCLSSSFRSVAVVPRSIERKREREEAAAAGRELLMGFYEALIEYKGPTVRVHEEAYEAEKP